MENAENKMTAAERDREFAALLKRRILEHEARAVDSARNVADALRIRKEKAREAANARSRRNYANDPAAHIARSKAWADAHAGKMREYKKKYWDNMPEEKRREYAERTNAVRRARMAENGGDNPYAQRWREYMREYQRKCRARKRAERAAKGNGTTETEESA